MPNRPAMHLHPQNRRPEANRPAGQQGAAVYWRSRLLAIAVLLSVLVISSPTPTGAQGTPVASQPTVCLSSEALEATPVTSPTIPVSTLSLQRASLILAAENSIACRNQGAWAIWLSLFTEEFRQEQFGETSLSEQIEQLRELEAAGFLLPIELVSIGEPIVTGSTGSIAITTREGHVLRREQWRFLYYEDSWLATEREKSPPLLDVNAVGIPFTIDDSGISTTRDQLVDPGAVIFRTINTLADQIDIVILANPAALSSEGLADQLASGESGQTTFVAWEQIDPLSDGFVVLSELPVGDYAVIAGFDPRTRGEAVAPKNIALISIAPR